MKQVTVWETSGGDLFKDKKVAQIHEDK